LSRRRRPDHFSRRARQQDYPARSVFKLEEIDARVRLLASGQRVLDLGCAPGSWLLYAARRVGPRGAVVGVDRAALSVDPPANARFVRADVMTLDPGEVRPEGGFHVVLSDMAPDTSGAALVDQERSWELFSRALELALATLRVSGGFLGKLFLSERHEEATRAMKARFAEVRTLRPRATRSSSKEVFVAGLGLDAGRGSSPPRGRRSRRGSRRPRG
jgi:23S rRNA (uridine2552-2'-O)-methyltransferase